MRTKTGALTLWVLCSALFAAGAFAAYSIGEPGRNAGKQNPLKNVYFGEQHMHTVNSPDAFAFGTRNTPDDAYRFCKGEPVKIATTGKTHQKKTPYDWCALTDHAEYMGVMPLVLQKDNPIADTEIGKDIASGDPKKGEEAFQKIITSVSLNKPIHYMSDPKVMQSIWDEQKKITNKHNDPGKFTTLIAFEWTSIPQYQNLHHNVFFRDDKGSDTQFSSFDSVKREDLWTYQEVQRESGHENFSIPHNSNVSNGLMFPPHTSYGTQITREWAERSTANTVAVEMAQTKGASETNPALSPTDEFAGFEDYYHNLLGSGGVVGKVDGSFVRQGLITGIGFQEMLGANPYKFGVVGGADTHNAASDNEEFNYFGVHGNTDKTPEVRLGSTGSVAGEPARRFSTPATTAVWALKDPNSGNLDRVQIVKGWFERGYAFEKVYDVVWADADKRKVGADGKVPPVGNTVDIKKASYTNDIGDTQLSAVWTDPDFNPSHHAVYYVRVLEIPTPRWTTYDAKALGIDPPADVAATIQERAWSSPIWYTPTEELERKLKKPTHYYGLQPFIP